MFLGELLFAFGMALLFTAIFVLGFRTPGPWAVWWTFFLIIFLAAWAGGLWITPAGPVFVGIYWLPIVMVAFIVALLLAAVSPISRQQHRVETITQAERRESTAEKVLDVFFWLVLISLAAVILLGYWAAGQQAIVTEV